MKKHQQILIQAIKNSGMTAREIANRVGIHESTLSKFLDGKSDLKAENYFSILNVLPESQRQIAQAQLGFSPETKLESVLPLLAHASREEQALVLRVIADCWLNNSGTSDRSSEMLAV
ncbi:MULTISPECIES: helix-turn-helix domain-containing protein [Nostocales]|uniref:HTH cro/C1-type domain-containing protein n=2 Tax=Tolypothrix TaxID=111782 RepID=A0A0C1RCA3_9CYAN